MSFENLRRLSPDNFLRQKFLRIKYFLKGKLTLNEFNELLEFDFKSQLKNAPPISGIFSPEKELAKIRNLPKEQKQEALKDYKEKLARQREGLAACSLFIERLILFNNDVPKEELIRWVERFSGSYGFDDRQKQIFVQAIDKYFEQRKKALDFRKKFPNDYDLVRELTGLNLTGRENIRVSVGPMTIDIEADAFTSGRLYERVTGKPVIDFYVLGFAGESKGVYYIVLNKDTRLLRMAGTSLENTRWHEYTHQKNKLFKIIFENQGPLSSLNYSMLIYYAVERDPQVKKTILEDFFYLHRKFALAHAKNEIISCLQDFRRKNLSNLRSQLEYIFFQQDNSPYDYLAYLRNINIFKNDQFYQETMQRMLVKEYREIIEKAVDSLIELVSKGKYSIKEAVALLIDKSLEDWPKTVKRLLAYRIKKN